MAIWKDPSKLLSGGGQTEYLLNQRAGEDQPGDKAQEPGGWSLSICRLVLRLITSYLMEYMED